MPVLPPVLVPRNPQQITGPRYEPTRYASNQSQSQVYSPQSEGSPLTFDYPGMYDHSPDITRLIIVFQKGLNMYVCKKLFTTGNFNDIICRRAWMLVKINVI